MPLGTRDDRAVGRGLVPLGPLALILVLPCVAGGANELPRTSVDTVFGAWSAIGVAVVVGIGIVLGAMGVLVARWSRARLLGAPAEVAAILVAIALGCGVLVTSRSLGTGRSLGSRSLPPHSLAWAEREDALRLVELARYAGKPVIVDFTAYWCPRLIELEEDTAEHGRLRDETARFVRIHVDASDDTETVVRTVLTHFGVVGANTILVLDSSGREALRFDTPPTPDRLRAALEQVH